MSGIRFDLKNNVDLKVALEYGTYKVDADGIVIDLQGYNAVAFFAVVGTATDGVLNLKLQDSNDGVTFADVASQFTAEESFTTIDNTKSNTVQKIGYFGPKRYVKVVLTVTGTPATGAEVGVYAVLGSMRHIGTAV